MHFVDPSHPLKPSLIEPMFSDECAAMGAANLTASLCPDSVIHNGKPLRNVPADATVAYRGWMLNALEYRRWTEAVEAAGAKPLASVEQYLAAHHCPNWYPLIAEYTPETRVFPVTADLESQLRSLGWAQFFIKDYVKSLKTSRGSIISDPPKIRSLLAEMQRVRGEIEGGLCVRQVEDFMPESERRYFVLNGRAYSADNSEIPATVREVAGKIPSPFFSIDAIVRRDHVMRIVEIGDGQVSDLTGWTPLQFAGIWRRSQQT